MDPWQLKLLGDCELLSPNGRQVAFSTRKSLAMLAFLARQPGRRAKRQRIAALLWEDAAQEQSRLHVRKALWLVRTESAKAAADAEPPVDSATDSICLASPGVITDVDAFLEALESAGDEPAALEAACDLYTADFLSDFSVRNAPAFEDWTAAERQHLREIAISARTRLIDLLLARPTTTEAAMRATLRLLAIDALQEHAHRALMRLHVRQGRPAAALAHYHGFRETLQRELGVDPEPKTQDLFREISQGRRSAAERPASGSPDRRPAEDLGPDEAKPGRPTRARPGIGWAATALGAALLLVAFYILYPAAGRPPEVERVFPITANLVMTGRPALSPDGSRLIFTARPRDSSNVDLFLTTIGDAEPVRLTQDEDIDDNAAWSPDGTSIAFVRADAAADTACQIYMMTVPTGSARQVGRCGNSLNTGLAWSRDGQTLFYSDRPQPDAPERIYSLDLQTGSTRSVTSPPAESFGDRDPAVSEDGNSIAFLRDYAGRSTDLFTLDVESGDVRRLTSEGGTISGVVWSNGDEGLFYSSDRGGDAGLWWLPVDGGDAHRISAGLLDYRRITHARDRPRLVFEAIRDRSELAVIAPEGAADQSPAPIPALRSDARDTYPDVGRDGAIVFVSTRSGQEQLWIADPGSAPRQLTQLEGWRLTDPRWSPDARHIAFVASQGGTTDLFVMRREGGAPVRLTNDAAEDAAPAWSRDGQTLYFGSRRGGESRIWRIAPFASQRTARPVSQAGPGDLRIDPEGRWLYYLYPGRSGIWRRALAPDGKALVGPEEQLVEDFAAGDWTNWAVSDTALYYASRPAGLGAGRIRRLDLTTGRTEDVADAAPIHRQSSFSVAPDGRLIVPIRSIEVGLFGMELSH